MQFLFPLRRARIVVSAGLILSLSVGYAQPQTSNPKNSRLDPISPEAPVEALAYRSPFVGYKTFLDEPVRSWKESNNLAGKIGGWRVYAKEALQPDSSNEKNNSTPAKKDAESEGGQR